ncbi:Glucosyltransferase-like protein [Taxawa tesnikishii (nom. ined.)]|nr:Glucosyltransferase-like protein [Dothideales sp. JES 119]
MATGLFKWATGFWGYSGNLVNPSWFELYSSRGLESHDLKIFMRATVIVSEYLILVPAAVICLRHLSRLSAVSSWESSIALTAVLMQPATILIDNAHFQYNTVMLGFVVAAISSLLSGRLVWSCVYFVAALGFKQMALFYAPAVFAYLLGACVFPRINILRLINIALATLASFAILFLPILVGAMYDSYRNVSLHPTRLDVLPLLKRVDLGIPYAVLTLLWAYLMGLPPASLSAYFGAHSGGLSLGTKLLHLAFYALMVAWHFGEAFLPAPANKPDIWVVGNVCLGAAGFDNQAEKQKKL